MRGEEGVGEDQCTHGFGNRHNPGTDAWIVAAVGFDGLLIAVERDCFLRF
jgi:hypothetical protein